MQINLVVALPAEARPLIAHFGLKRQQPEGDFPLYRNDHIALVLSRTGKAAAAAATLFLHAHNGHHKGAIWLNIGIAGHASRPVGNPVLARRITDGESMQNWNIRLDFKPPCDREQLLTLNQPAFDYLHPCAYDMEAAGFFPAAHRLTAAGLVHCFKIISDNRENPGRGISARQVSRLIEEQLEILSLLCAQLESTASASGADGGIWRS